MNLAKNKQYFICAINPGSTSTKTAIFKNDTKIAQNSITHHFPACMKSMWDQFDHRLSDIQHFIETKKLPRLDAVVGRGGLLRPVQRGVYIIDETLLHDARKGVQGEHPSNMGAELAHKVAGQWNCPAFVVDPVSVDEFEPIARYSGHPFIERRALSHALNIGAAANWSAQKQGIELQKSRYIVGHLGGGISIAAVKGGRIIDVNDASSAGPFSPERSGSLPMQQFLDLCFSGKYTKQQLQKMLMGEGGLVAYLGTHDLRRVEEMIRNGDRTAKKVFEAMIYQIAKEIAGMVAVFSRRPDGIALTGGLTHSQMLLRGLERRVSFLAPILVFKGELEMEAMANSALDVLSGKKRSKRY